MESKEEVEFYVNTVKPEFMSNVQWAEPVEPTEPNEYEKSLLKGTLNVTELLEQEKNETKKVETEEEAEARFRKEYITKVKVIALDRMNKHPLENSSFFQTREKKRLMEHMEKVMKLTLEEINNEFNNICTDVLFAPESDYTKYCVYNV